MHALCYLCPFAGSSSLSSPLSSSPSSSPSSSWFSSESAYAFHSSANLEESSSRCFESASSPSSSRTRSLLRSASRRSILCRGGLPVVMPRRQSPDFGNLGRKLRSDQHARREAASAAAVSSKERPDTASRHSVTGDSSCDTASRPAAHPDKGSHQRKQRPRAAGPLSCGVPCAASAARRTGGQSRAQAHAAPGGGEKNSSHAAGRAAQGSATVGLGAVSFRVLDAKPGATGGTCSPRA